MVGKRTIAIHGICGGHKGSIPTTLELTEIHTCSVLPMKWYIIYNLYMALRMH